MPEKVKMAVKKAKAKMKARACCDSDYPGAPGLYVSVDEAANGYQIRMNNENFVAKDKKEALKIINEILS